MTFLHWLTAHLPVYRKGHICHADGSLYMGRWGIFETPWLTARIHHIATPDLDRHMHDHPAAFVSVLLHGGYVEARPAANEEPCFRGGGDIEATQVTPRSRIGSIIYRRATDRHKITHVQPDTYTLFLFIGGRRHWWGFYTPAGKVWWRDYASCHTNGQAAQQRRPA